MELSHPLAVADLESNGGFMNRMIAAFCSLVSIQALMIATANVHADSWPERPSILTNPSQHGDISYQVLKDVVVFEFPDSQSRADYVNGTQKQLKIPSAAKDNFKLELDLKQMNLVALDLNNQSQDVKIRSTMDPKIISAVDSVMIDGAWAFSGRTIQVSFKTPKDSAFVASLIASHLGDFAGTFKVLNIRERPFTDGRIFAVDFQRVDLTNYWKLFDLVKILSKDKQVKLSWVSMTQKMKLH